LEKSDFLNRAKVPKKSDFFLEKSDFSTVPGAQQIGKNRISQPCQVPNKLGKIGFLKPCQGAQEIRFGGKIGFLFKKQNL
jgi:hypothetical protein